MVLGDVSALAEMDLRGKPVAAARQAPFKGTYALYRDNGKENGNCYYILFGFYRGYIGIMGKNMETTITDYIGFEVWGFGV